MTHRSSLVLLAAFAAGCGGPPRLVVELAAPVELTEERSTGFDAELLEDNGTATFAGRRLASPTVSRPYDGIDVLVGGQRIWSLDAPIRANLFLIDGVVVEVDFYGDGYPDAAMIETVGRDVTARFDAWQEKDPAYWPYIVRDLPVIATSEYGVGKAAGWFVHASGVKADIFAACSANASETSYWIKIRMTAPGRRW